MFRIGEFSRISRVPVKTLRYYDEIGLLKPAQVDRFTDYRYYTAEQLPRLNRILALKELGFTLEQVAQLLDEELPVAEIRGMFKLKRAEIEQRVAEERERLARLEARLAQIEQENNLPAYDVVVKRIEPLRVAALRAVAPTVDDIGDLFEQVEACLQTHGLRASGFPFTIWHDSYYSEQDIDLEVCIPVDRLPPTSDRARFCELPGIEFMACLVHHGAYTDIDQACQSLGAWIDTNGYSIAGPNREIYLRFGVGGSGAVFPPAYLTRNPAEFVTELQFPVQPSRPS